MDREIVYIQEKINELEFQKNDIDVELDKLHKILKRLE